MTVSPTGDCAQNVAVNYEPLVGADGISIELLIDESLVRGTRLIQLTTPTRTYWCEVVGGTTCRRFLKIRVVL
jgi:hypothetical protein